MLDLVLVRAVLVLVFAAAAYFLHPADASPWVSAGVGSVTGALIILFEIRLEQISLKRLIGAAAGSVLGIAGAFLMSLVLSKANAPPYLQVALLLLMTYVGLFRSETADRRGCRIRPRHRRRLPDVARTQ